MRKPRQLVLPGVLLTVAVALSGCGGDDDGTAAPAPATTAAATPSASPTASPSASATASTSASASDGATPTPTASSSKPQDGTTIVVKFAGGKATTASKRVKVERGDTVRLTVTSDVSEEIHVHTYDHRLDLQAGKPGTLEFKADIGGVIEVELEKSGTGIVELQVG